MLRCTFIWQCGYILIADCFVVKMFGNYRKAIPFLSCGFSVFLTTRSHYYWLEKMTLSSHSIRIRVRLMNLHPYDCDTRRERIAIISGCGAGERAVLWFRVGCDQPSVSTSEHGIIQKLLSRAWQAVPGQWPCPDTVHGNHLHVTPGPLELGIRNWLLGPVSTRPPNTLWCL